MTHRNDRENTDLEENLKMSSPDAISHSETTRTAASALAHCRPQVVKSNSSQLSKSYVKANEGKDTKTGRWTRDEHFRFLEALKLYGKEWKYVQTHVGTRSST